jgi:heme-degrading monooxygenase HmoA
MWVRASSYALPVTDLDRAIEKFNQGVDAFLQQPGLRRIEVFVNRDNGAAMTVTHWASKEAMNASAEYAEHLREDVVLEVIGWTQRVNEYELVRTEELQDKHGSVSAPT